MKLATKAIFFVINLCLSSTFANVHRRESKEYVDYVNSYVDGVLKILRENEIQPIDPYKISDRCINIDDLDIELTNTVIKGLTSIHRTGDCFYDNNYNILEVYLEVKDIEMLTNYAVASYWIKGEMVASVDHVSLRIKLLYDIYPRKVLGFEVTDFGDYRVNRITGLYYPFNWILEIILNSAFGKSTEEIIRRIETDAPRAITDDILKRLPPL